MPERWERNLRELGRASVPTARLRERIEQGPSTAPALEDRPGRRAVAGVVAFAVFFAAGGFAWYALRESGSSPAVGSRTPSSAVVTLRAVQDRTFPHPKATLTVGGVAVEGQPTSYGWDSAIIDVDPPTFRETDFVVLEPAAELSLQGDADWAEVRAHPADSFLTGEGVLIGRLDQPQRLDLAPGRYVLEIRAHWFDHGNPSFYFGVELRNPPANADTLIMPDLVGLPHQRALRLLANLGIASVPAFRELVGVETWHVAETSPAAGEPVGKGDQPVTVVIAGEDEPPLPERAVSLLSCGPAEQVAFTGPRFALLPAGSTFISANTSGVDTRVHDVRHVFGPGDSGIYAISRKPDTGEVLAVVAYGTLAGVACEGSGIAGA